MLAEPTHAVRPRLSLLTEAKSDDAPQHLRWTPAKATAVVAEPAMA